MPPLMIMLPADVYTPLMPRTPPAFTSFRHAIRYAADDAITPRH